MGTLGKATRELIQERLGGYFVYVGVERELIENGLGDLREHYELMPQNPHWVELRYALEEGLSASDEELDEIVRDILHISHFPLDVDFTPRSLYEEIYRRVFLREGPPPTRIVDEPEPVPDIEVPGLQEQLGIEWVHIPAGEFFFGLTEQQVKRLQRITRRRFNHWLISPWAHLALNRVLKAMWRKPYQKGQSQYGEISYWVLDVINRENSAAQILRAEEYLHQFADGKKIHLDGFWISKYPVTLTQYNRFLRLTGQPEEPLPRNKEDYEWPIQLRTWEAADTFARMIGCRLPTREQWEKAARGVQDDRLYPWGDDWDVTKGNVERGARKYQVTDGFHFSPVDDYPQGASPFGVLDMVGNNFEFTDKKFVSKGHHPSSEDNEMEMIFNLISYEFNIDAQGHFGPGYSVRLVKTLDAGQTEAR